MVEHPPAFDVKPEFHVKWVCEFTVCSTVCETAFARVGAGREQ